jgi:hypothetical protein
MSGFTTRHSLLITTMLDACASTRFLTLALSPHIIVPLLVARYFAHHTTDESNDGDEGKPRASSAPQRRRVVDLATMGEGGDVSHHSNPTTAPVRKIYDLADLQRRLDELPTGRPRSHTE